MNLLELHKKLIAAARATPPDDRVPYAFEKRIMTRLAGKTALTVWDLWGRALSRAAVVCVIFMLALVVASFYVPASNPDSLSQDVEKTLFAAVDNTSEQGGDLR
ncbi:MAG TPA: hypothetical protein VFC07_13615 [Verrucomicrobiae bacterium]|nr:hypothetical protein [Verrucomicrobiae bacterium]